MADNVLEFLIPGALHSATGGYVYNRRMLTELRALGWKVTVRALDASFPDPTPAALEHADRVLTDIPSDRLVLIDGLAFSAMPQILGAHAARLPLVALLHMPLSAGVQADSERLARLRQTEACALRSARSVIVTGRGSFQTLLEFGVSAAQIALIEPGTDAAPLARRCSTGTLRLLCVATVHAGKGHEQLIEALGPLASLPWQLTCVGSLTRSPDTVARVRDRVLQLGLEGRVVLAGEMQRAALERHYRRSDLFVLATRFESYCMAVAEALAHGLPVVSTRTGAMPDLVGTHAGRLVPPGDLEMLRAALAAALRDPTLLAAWAEGAAAVRQRLPPWSDAAARLAALLQDVGTGGAPRPCP